MERSGRITGQLTHHCTNIGMFCCVYAAVATDAGAASEGHRLEIGRKHDCVSLKARVVRTHAQYHESQTEPISFISKSEAIWKDVLVYSTESRWYTGVIVAR